MLLDRIAERLKRENELLDLVYYCFRMPDIKKKVIADFKQTRREFNEEIIEMEEGDIEFLPAAIKSYPAKMKDVMEENLLSDCASKHVENESILEELEGYLEIPQIAIELEKFMARMRPVASCLRQLG